MPVKGRWWAYGLGCVIGGLAVAACGITAKPNGTGQPVGRNHAGGHLRPNGSRTSPAPGANNHGSAVGGANGFATALPLNPVVRQAMQWLSSRTTVPLAAPVQIPLRNSGYLSALAQALGNTYAVHLIDVQRPLAVNSPLAGQELSPHPFVASFGVMRLNSSLPAGGVAKSLAMLAMHNANWQFDHPTSPGSPLPLGQGITGSEYMDPQGPVLQWQEGSWTLQVAGGDAPSEAGVAGQVVTYLHSHFLPPYPGVMAIQVASSGPVPTAVTYIDWMEGHLLYYVESSHATAANPVQTCTMAVTMGSLR